MDYFLNGILGGAFAEWVEALLAVIGAASAVAAGGSYGDYEVSRFTEC